MAEQYPEFSDHLFLKRVVKFTIIKALVNPWVFARLQSALMFLGMSSLEGLLHPHTRLLRKHEPDIRPLIRFRPSKRMIALLKRRLTHVNAARFDAREASIREFLTMLEPQIVCPGHGNMNHSFWAVLITATDAAMLVERLMWEGFITPGITKYAVNAMRNLPHTDVLSSIGTDDAKSLRHIEYLSEHEVDLPFGHAMPRKQVKRLAGIVNEVFKSQSHLRQPYEPTCL